MEATPTATPVAIPVLGFMLAIAGLEDDHVPPVTESERVILLPIHIEFEPEIKLT